ncbi:MAG: hypothetical protein WBP56_24285 [Polyangia bacterium]
MKILIIEDDPNKSRELMRFVREDLLQGDVTERRSYQSGLQAAVELKPRLILLDMSMPTYDISSLEKGGRPRPFSGYDILAELKRRNLAVGVVVVTQFESFGTGEETQSLDELAAKMGAEFEGRYWGTVFYEPSESGWRNKLREIVQRRLKRDD